MELLTPYYYLLSLFTCLWLWIQLCSASDVTYAKLCSSIVPESTTRLISPTTHHPLPGFPPRQAGFFRGGSSILDRSSSKKSEAMNYLTFVNSGISNTDTPGLYKLDAYLELRSSNSLNSAKSDFVNLRLSGFWSELSGKLCMVGSTTGPYNGGVVLKLNYTTNPNITNSLITGTLVSLSSIDDLSFFDPVSILAFSHLDYVYTISDKDFDYSDDVERVLNRPISSLTGGGMCSMLSSTPNLFHLTDLSSCELKQNCSAFAGIDLKLFSWISFDKFSCDEKNARVRAMVNFHNNIEFYRADNLEASLIAEGIWDSKKNQLVFKACRFYNTSGFLYEVSVGDCTIIIIWRFPAVWSIKDSSAVLGRIRSIRSVNYSLYFDDIMFVSNDVRMTGAQGLKYEYTQIDKVRSHCRSAGRVAARARYPDGTSDELKFGMFVSSSDSRFALGASLPLFVNDLHYEDFSVLWSRKSKSANEFQNISYRIGLTLMRDKTLPNGVVSLFSKFNGLMTAWISAEGRYDSSNGNVCMIGCLRLFSGTGNRSVDCEILVKFQIPPLGANNGSNGYIKGSIDSLRNMSDPLYFDHMDLVSSAFVSDFANRKMASSKTKLIVLLLSEIVAPLLVLVQLRYVTKNPKVLPFISISMLSVLALHFFASLVSSANLLARFHSRVGSVPDLIGWVQLEAKEIISTVIIFMVFVLLFRLVHLTWRSRHQTTQLEKNELRTAECKSLLSSILFYIIGASIVAAATHVKYQDLKLHFTISLGLMFLVPQAGNEHAKVQPLCHLFYIGITVAAVTEYVVGIVGFGESIDGYEKGLMYVMVGVGVGVVCCLVIFLQQKFGGRWILIIGRCECTVGMGSSEGSEEESIELTA